VEFILSEAPGQRKSANEVACWHPAVDLPAGQILVLRCSPTPLTIPRP